MKPTVTVLSDDELRRIHRAALRILEQVGFRLPDDEACRLLAGAGAEIGPDQLVRFPAELIETALARAPKRSEVVLYGRDPVHDFRPDQDGPALAAMTMAVDVIDPQTGRRRPATNDDLAALTRLVDSLDLVRVNGGLVTPQEVPAGVNDWYTWATCLKNTTKHITGGVLGKRGVRDAVAMAALVLGGEAEFKKRPCISGWVLTLPPLGLDRDSVAALIEMARLGVPIILSSGPILGTTSPVTLAGAMAQAHAEIMAGIALAQTASPGATVVYTSFARGVDMRTGTVSMACPEFALLKAGLAQLGRSLDLPVRMPALLRDSKLLDAQAGFETGLVGAFAAPGADLMDAMQLDMDMVVDYADPIFCHEAMAGLRRLCRPVDVADRDLALEVIEQVGPGGNFLTNSHTFANFRQELWHPDLFERRIREAWEKDGAQDIRTKALGRAKTFLAQKKEPLVGDDVARAVDEIVEAARIDYAT